MTPRAILFGSIGTLAETSSIQRDAFNASFAEAGLDWVWDAATYDAMLHMPGGLRRIETFNRARGARIDAAAIHARKTELFREHLEGGIALRPGVHDLLAAARAASVKLALCSTTDRGTVETLLRTARPALPEGAFDFVGDVSTVSRPKPDPEIFTAALRALAVAAAEAVVIEDSPENAAAARFAGLRVVAFPGERHAHRPFPGAERTLRRLDPGAFGLGLTGAPLAVAG